MEKNLDFRRTLTVEQFKDEKKVRKLSVKAGADGKYFFQYGGETGPVATNNHSLNEVLENPMVSYVKGEATEKNPSGLFWMLHMEGQGGAEVVATL